MPKKYKVIVKIKNNPDGTAYCLKYRVTDLIKFTWFLDEKWAEWKWFNVYSNTGINIGEQLANFTKKQKAWIKICLVDSFCEIHQKKKYPLIKVG